MLTTEQHRRLNEWTRRHKTPQALALRARIVLACQQDCSNRAVARQLRVSPQTVRKWRGRFRRAGIDGLLDEPRAGAPRTISAAVVEQVVAKTLHERPREAAHWSSRAMAKACGLSQTAVVRIWRVFGLQPHRAETFELSAGALSVEKVRDIVGLYLSPPDRALVLCVDRAQPPMMPGTTAPRAHERHRPGAIALFAALDGAAGKAAGEPWRRHWSEEFQRFLRALEPAVPKKLDVHLVLHNYRAHTTRGVNRWLARNPHCHVHFAPTSAAWLSQAGRWFAALTDRQVRRTAHGSTVDLERATRDYLSVGNGEPKPFVWIKTRDQSPESFK
jgi:transposase